MGAFLHAPVDAGFVGWGGDPRIMVGAVVLLLITAAVFLLGIAVGSRGLMYVAGPAMVAGSVTLRVVRRRIPVWWVAVRGTQVTLIGTVRNMSNTPVPTRVFHEGPLSDVTRVPGSASSVQVGSERVFFLRHKASAMAVLAPGRSA